jgi:transcription antitermination factor NusG
MPHWIVARTEPHREAFAQRCLAMAGFTSYLPRLRLVRRSAGRKVETRPPLFPGYAFVLIELQWHAARWTPGVVALVGTGTPTRVPDSIVAEIKSREVNGLVELPPRPLHRGDPVCIVGGIFTGQFALYDGQRPGDRVAVLLGLLGRLTLPADHIEAV